MSLDLTTIVQQRLSNSNFFSEDYPKSQIYLHHTAGNDNAIGTVDDWSRTAEKVATAFVIDRSGKIVQAFHSSLWAYHLGLQMTTFNQFKLPYRPLDKTSVGIELCNWGYLNLVDEKYKTYVNSTVKPEDVYKFEAPFRGFQYYQKYTDAQLLSLKNLLSYLCEKYSIPKTYDQDMFIVNPEALSGKSGIWSHTSVRYDKTDCFPQKELVDVLTSLSA
jgi:N-acetyl-anhydromuramyl-L-alanine amidase AmpD